MEIKQNGLFWKGMFLWLLVFIRLTNMFSMEDGTRYTQSTRQRFLVDATAQNDVSARFTSVRSKRQCASLCMANNGCVSFFYNTKRRACKLVSKQILSSGTPLHEIHSRYYVVDCSFPPYQDGAMVDYISTTFNAEANYLCVKGYSTIGSGTTVCLSNGTWSETDLVCSAFSHSKWERVATTKASTTRSDQRDDLKNRIFKTCKPMIRVKTAFEKWDRVTYLSLYGFYWRTGIWGQAIRGLRKSSWDSFKAIPEREFELFVSDRKSSYMFVDNNGKATKSMLKTDLTWFVKDDQCISTSHSSDTGSVLMSLFEGEIDSNFVTIHVDKSNSTACVQGTFDVSHSRVPTFSTPPYWFVQKYCSSGRQHVLRWWITGAYLSRTVGSSAMSWCPDTCWHHVLDTGISTTNKDKQVRHVTNGVLFGHNIVLKVDNVVAKAREIILHDGHVTVSVNEFWLPADKFAFSSGSLQAWMIASTTGHVVQCSHFPESPRVKEIKEEEKHSIWFLDSRQWDKVLSIDGTGTVLSGSKSTLLNKVNEGRSLRVGVLHTHGIYKALEVDSVDVSRTGQIAVNVIHNVDLGLRQNNFRFSDTCHVVSSIISTEGSYKKYIYNIGTGGNHSSVAGVAKIEWFIEM